MDVAKQSLVMILAAAAAVAANGCSSNVVSPPPEKHVGVQSQAVLGDTTYEIFCHAADVPHLKLAFAYGRIAANSPAFAECINTAFSQFVSVTPPGYGGINIGPFNACSNDPPTPGPGTVLTSTMTANPTRIVCDYSALNTSRGGFAGVGGVAASDSVTAESIALGSELGWFQNTSAPCFLNQAGIPCASDQGYAETGATIFHEIMHQHGYSHFEYGSPPDLCGIPASQNPYYGNSVPYQVGECLRAVLEDSIANCPIHDDCGPGGGLKLQDSIFAATPTCSCVSDPKPGDPPLLSPPLSLGSPTNCGVLTAGQGLVGSTANASVSSCSGQYSLWMQTDGNVVLYQNGAQAVALWATGTVGQGKTFVMQGDGNLVLYNAMPAPIWANNTPGQPGSYLAVQDDGNLVVYSSNGQVLWALNRPQPPTGCGILTAGQGLSQGASVLSCNGNYMLVMQGDGNLVLYRWNGGPIWATGTRSGPIVSAQMQGDGNFVVVDFASDPPVPTWSTNTWGNQGAYIRVQDDGNVVVYDVNNAPLWASNTCVGC